MKAPISISVEQDQMEMLKHFCEVSGIPMSKLFEDHVSALCNTIRVTGLDKKKKYSRMDLVKMFVRGTFQPIA